MTVDTRRLRELRLRGVARRRPDIDATIERLLELPAEIAAERKRPQIVVSFDEFQEVTRHRPAASRR